MVFDEHQLRVHSRALDLLGVGIVLSRAPVPPDTGTTLLGGDTVVHAYQRTSPWPRAFFADRVVLYDKIHDLTERIQAGDGHPFVAVEHSTLQSNLTLQTLLAQSDGRPATVVKARDYALTNNSTSFTVDAPAAGVLYLGEVDDPGGFEVLVNEHRVPYIAANHAFKAVPIDRAGVYRVTFRYWPAHLERYLTISAVGCVLWVTTLAVFVFDDRRRTV
jgi:hypothetical protein